MGNPNNRAIHIIGIPSAGQISLSNNASRNSWFLRLVISQLTLGVETKNGAPLPTAESILPTRAVRSRASTGMPSTPNTSRDRLSGAPPTNAATEFMPLN